MKLSLLTTTTFSMEGHILCAAPISQDEWAILFSNGQVTTWNPAGKAGKHLFKVGSDRNSFDLKAAASIYTLWPVVVVVNDFDTKGYAYNTEKELRISLWRGADRVGHCPYPIALTNGTGDSIHLIHGTDWNRVDIMDMNSAQVITADKSRIEKNAEVRMLEQLGSKKIKGDMIPWPRNFDYYYCQLLLSPSKRRFLSRGWGWGSADWYKIFDVEEYLHSNRINCLTLGFWEHCNRPACWIDDNTIAIPYSPFVDDGAAKETPLELHIYDISGIDWDTIYPPDYPEVTRVIQFKHWEHLPDELFYSKEADVFIDYCKQRGVTLSTPEGEAVFNDTAIGEGKYYPEYNQYMTIKEKTITVYQLTP